MTNLEELTNAYIECALWCGVEYPMGDPRSDHDKDYTKTIDDLHPDTLATMRGDCFKFFDANRETIEACDVEDKWAMAGHDFWLTRNHHGSGFWDGDWPEGVSEELTTASHGFGEFDLYTGDDSDRVYHL